MKKFSKISYQGAPGSYSYEAIKNLFPNAKTFGFATFEEVLEAVASSKAQAAFLPVENSNAGRVSFSYILIPRFGLKIVGQYFLHVRHNLIGPKSATLKSVKTVYSHPQALAQCSKFIHKHKFFEVPFSDTALSVEYVVKKSDSSKAAIASSTAAQIYGGKILAKNISNDKNNTTRFLIVSKKAQKCSKDKKCIVAIYFEVKNIPAALFKCLSGFATEKINIIKLESYVPAFNGKAEFYLEFEKPNDLNAQKRALQELEFFAKKMEILGEFN